MRPQTTIILFLGTSWVIAGLLLLAIRLAPDALSDRVIIISIIFLLLLVLVAVSAFAIRDVMAKRALVGRHGLAKGGRSDVRPWFQFKRLWETNVAIKNVFCGDEAGVKYCVFDRIVRHPWAVEPDQEGETFYAAECQQWHFPSLTVLPVGTFERLGERVAESFRSDEVDSVLDRHRFGPETTFWEDFWVDGFQKDIDRLLTQGLIHHFEKNLGLALEIRPEQMLIYYPDVSLALYQVPEFIQECQALQRMVRDSFVRADTAPSHHHLQQS